MYSNFRITIIWWSQNVDHKITLQVILVCLFAMPQ